MSISCVFRCVCRRISSTVRILRPRDYRQPDEPRARRVPRRRRPLHRRARRGVLPPLRRPQGDARGRADLRAARGADAAGDGETIPFRMLRVALSNEPDRDRRERIERERLALTDEHLNPVYLEAARIDREAVRALDAPNYYELYKQFGFRLDELADECGELLDATERTWEEVGDRLFRERLGLGLADARSWDVARLCRAPEWDAAYRPEAMVPALEATLSELGIDLRAQANV